MLLSLFTLVFDTVVIGLTIWRSLQERDARKMRKKSILGMILLDGICPFHIFDDGTLTRFPRYHILLVRLPFRLGHLVVIMLASLSVTLAPCRQRIYSTYYCTG
jgi:hypothetical protein